MALPTYNADYHHVGLKAVGGTMYGFMLDGAYIKEPQREAAGAPDFGGSTDVIGQSASVARWTQDDFVGGMYAYDWGKDDAMFADCTGFISNPQGRSLLSCPPLKFVENIDPDSFDHYISDLGVGDKPLNMFIVGTSMYLVFEHVLIRYNLGTDTVTSKYNHSTEALEDNYHNVFGEYDSNDQMIWILQNSDITAETCRVVRVKLDLTDPTYDQQYLGPPRSANIQAKGGTLFNRHIIIQVGRRLWIGDPPDNPTTVVNEPIRWMPLGRVPGVWRDAVPYNNLLYILIGDNTYRTSLYAFDGDALMPVCTFAHNFAGKCMIEYGGRLFVGGMGTDVNGNEHYAELYEITGSSQRLIRTFGPEARTSTLASSGQWPRQFDDLQVYEGMLWMCEKGKRLVAYDITSDGFFGASEILANTDLNITKMTSGRGKLWAWGHDDSDDTKHGVYRIAISNDLDSVGDWNPTMITSDFVYEPAMKKRWSEIVVMTRFAPCSSIEYSTDSGATWTSATITTEALSTHAYFTTASLQAITPSRMIRFRIKLDHDTPNYATDYHREIVSYTVAFNMLESGKLSFGLTINGSQEIERFDAELHEARTQTYTPSEIRTQLWAWFTDKTPLVFKDLDGTEYNVQLEHLRETRPAIAPNGEALYSMTLLNV